MMAVSYAQALYDLSKEENLQTQFLEQLETLQKVFADEPDFLRLLSVPDLSKQERCQLLDTGLRGKVHQYVLNFLKVLTEKGYARGFYDCVAAFRELYDAEHGILRVLAVSAVPLREEQSARLCQKLEAATGRSVRLTNRVDPTCLGGVRLDYDGKRLDGTVESHLNAIREMLKNTVL